jgi:hypothetical protein
MSDSQYETDSSLLYSNQQVCIDLICINNDSEFATSKGTASGIGLSEVLKMSKPCKNTLCILLAWIDEAS